MLKLNCKYCGVEMSEKEKFCPKCGRYLEENDQKKDPNKRKKIVSIIMAAIAVVFIVGIFGISYSPQGNRTTKEIISKVKKVEETKSAHTLKVKPDEFKEKFNSSNHAKAMKLEIGNIKIEELENINSFRYAFTENLEMLAYVDKNNFVKNINIVCIPNKEDNPKLVGAMGVLIDMFSPELSNDEKVKVLEDLGFAKDKNIYQANNKTVRGDIQYIFRYDSEYGFIFSVIAI